MSTGACPVSTNPWTPRDLRIYGGAETVDRGTDDIKVTPTISWRV